MKKILFDKFKDRPAIILENDGTKITVLPFDGGKIVSLTLDRFEFLEQAPGDKYCQLAYNGDYILSECSAWDDMFPTIDPYTLKIGERKYYYPDHGEISRLPLTYEIESDRARLFVKTYGLPFIWKKEICFADEGFIIRYSITNEGKETLPFIWAAHCMLAGSDDLKIETSYSEPHKIEYMFGAKSGDNCPIDRLMGKSKEGKSYKYYYTEPMPYGMVKGTYVSIGKEIKFVFDKNKVPYLGVWLNNGSFKDMYNIAMEIATAPYDRPDKAGKRCSKLKSGEEIAFDIEIQLKNLKGE